MRLALAFAMVLFIWAIPAAADLYRWVDPETGSVKFSNTPPPWYGDPEKERRAPKVELIPAVEPKPEAPPKPAPVAKPAAARKGGPESKGESLSRER